MNPVERRDYVVAQVAKFKQQGMTDRQAVLETVRTSGFEFIALPDQDVPKLYDDVTQLQANAAASPAT